jgi:pyridoxamine 5'-phosphate oxidase
MNRHLDELRREFADRPLNRADVSSDPFVQFDAWLREAIRTNRGPWYEPNAMTLATVDDDGRPDARIVLFKQVDAQGLAFFSNAASQKGRQLAATQQAAAVFYWGDLQRQVRLTGPVATLEPAAADAYWTSRPRGSQLGSACSRQSSTVESRQQLETQLADLTARYDGKDIPRPDNWVGYRIIPDTFEFWQGRKNRLHDRLRYRQTDGGWVIERLSP